MKTSTKNILLFIFAAILVVTPLILNPNAEYGGADGHAEEEITNINPEYEPWFSSIWEPPSGEIESLLFSLQAALGAGVIAYYVGYMKGKRKSAKNR